MMKRVAFLHTGAVVIPGFVELASELLPDTEVQHLLDDRIVADLSAGVAAAQIEQRLRSLVEVAIAAGSSAVLFTCSSISGYALDLGKSLGIPVFRVDEAMADAASTLGTRIGVVATLATTLRPTVELLHERSALLKQSAEISEMVVPGAFEAIVGGDRELHDQLVAQAIEAQASVNDVVVLAQASMASAAQRADVAVPVLTSPRMGIERLASFLSA